MNWSFEIWNLKEMQRMQSQGPCQCPASTLPVLQRFLQTFKSKYIDLHKFQVYREKQNTIWYGTHHQGLTWEDILIAFATLPGYISNRSSNNRNFLPKRNFDNFQSCDGVALMLTLHQLGTTSEGPGLLRACQRWTKCLWLNLAALDSFLCALFLLSFFFPFVFWLLTVRL